ncbi:putative replicase/helicase/endonuclease [Gigaspora margarita]|uniref:Putative replicase/helicase/endonuclease n=1 Tax=Gigaspora margarita TaxID=4874 RepID=A0A8H4AS39_GIGMA|nr:putative replicase/helicase/endonuclease [Gigaspora margarita]
MSLALNDQKTHQFLLDTEVIIIDKISMVSASLLIFISNLFACLCNNALLFGRIRVLLIEGLAQLPPVNGFHAMANNLNKLVCLSLSQEYENSEPFIATAIDLIDSQEIDPINNNSNWAKIGQNPIMTYMRDIWGPFVLTIYKTRELTIPNISVAIDEQMFACGQAYVAFSKPLYGVH